MGVRVTELTGQPCPLRQSSEVSKTSELCRDSAEQKTGTQLVSARWVYGYGMAANNKPA